VEGYSRAEEEDEVSDQEGRDKGIDGLALLTRQGAEFEVY